MRRHVDTLGWAFTIYGAFVLAAAAVACVVGLLLVLFTDALGVEVLGALALVATLVPLFALPFLLTGWGIRARRPWARITGLVLSVMVISDIPIGFALGAFGLGTLLDRGVRAEFTG